MYSRDVKLAIINEDKFPLNWFLDRSNNLRDLGMEGGSIQTDCQKDLTLQVSSAYPNLSKAITLIVSILIMCHCKNQQDNQLVYWPE